MKEYQQSIDTTLAAVEIGIEHQAEYSLRAKAYARVARAYIALDDV